MLLEELNYETVNVGDIIGDNFYAIKVESVTTQDAIPAPYVLLYGTIFTKKLKPSKKICNKYEIILDKSVVMIKKRKA